MPMQITVGGTQEDFTSAGPARRTKELAFKLCPTITQRVQL
jgi:hypothetical protein